MDVVISLPTTSRDNAYIAIVVYFCFRFVKTFVRKKYLKGTQREL